jgi:hypothetical protein
MKKVCGSTMAIPDSVPLTVAVGTGVLSPILERCIARPYTRYAMLLVMVWVGILFHSNS